MKRTTAPGHVGNLFVNADVANGIAPSEVDADWLNTLQEELCYLVEQTGITLDSPAGTKTQVRAAVLAMIANYFAANSPDTYLGNAVLTSSNFNVTDAALSAFPETFAVKFISANPASATLSLNGGTSAALLDNAGVALAAGDIAAGQIRLIVNTGTELRVATAAPGDFLKRDGSLAMTGLLRLFGNAAHVLDATPLQQVESLIAAAISGLSTIPSGTVAHLAMNTAPSGWLAADGSAVSRTTYAALFTAIGTTFGVGNGSTTFNIPDLRGEFVRGWDNGRGVDSGRVFGSAQTDAMQGHNHTLAFRNSAIGGGNGGIMDWILGEKRNDAVTTPVSDGTNGTPRIAAETRSRNIALLACIKY